MIDANRDGFIDKEDLKDTYGSLGVNYLIIIQIKLSPKSSQLSRA